MWRDVTWCRGYCKLIHSDMSSLSILFCALLVYLSFPLFFSFLLFFFPLPRVEGSSDSDASSGRIKNSRSAVRQIVFLLPLSPYLPLDLPSSLSLITLPTSSYATLSLSLSLTTFHLVFLSTCSVFLQSTILSCLLFNPLPRDPIPLTTHLTFKCGPPLPSYSIKLYTTH